jgi:hypothetical protein
MVLHEVPEMIRYTCDGCSREIPPKTLRYRVTIDVRAAYDKLEIGLAELVRDHRQELLKLIDSLSTKSPDEVEQSVYKKLKLDLCPSCQKAYINDPMHFHPEAGEVNSEVNIDDFLRSLGFPNRPDES